MKITINVLGYDIATVTLDLGDLLTPGPDGRLTPLDKGVKGMSNWWVRRMNR